MRGLSVDNDISALNRPQGHIKVRVKTKGPALAGRTPEVDCMFQKANVGPSSGKRSAVASRNGGMEPTLPLAAGAKQRLAQRVLCASSGVGAGP